MSERTSVSRTAPCQWTFPEQVEGRKVLWLTKKHDSLGLLPCQLLNCCIHTHIRLEIEHDRAVAKPYFWPCLKSVQMAGIPAPHRGKILTSVTGQGFWLTQLPLSTAAIGRNSQAAMGRYSQSWRQEHVAGTGAVASRGQYPIRWATSVCTLPLQEGWTKTLPGVGSSKALPCWSCRNSASSVVPMGDLSPGCDHRGGHSPAVSQMWGDKTGSQTCLGNAAYMQFRAFFHSDANRVKTIWRTESWAKLSV